MPLHPTAEYSIGEIFLAIEGPSFVTHTKGRDASFVNIYIFPNTLIGSFGMKCSSLQELSISLSTEERIMRIKSTETDEEIAHEIDKKYFLSDNRRNSRHIHVESIQSKDGEYLLGIYIDGQRAFTIEEKGIEGFYYNSDAMKVYAYIPALSIIKEYDIFAVEKIHPNGFCFIYPKYMKVFLPSKSYTVRGEHNTDTAISLFCHKNTLYTVLSENRLIMYKNQFKRYPDNFVLSKIWIKHRHIYTFSQESRKLLVLNRKLEIEYEISADNVFVTDSYVFISKKDRTITHCTKTFEFVFLIEGFSITDGIKGIRQVKDTLVVISTEAVSDKPLFSLLITEIDITKKSVNKKIPIFSNNHKNNVCDILPFFEEADAPYTIPQVSDVSFAVCNSGYLAFCIASDSIYVVWPEYAAKVPISLIKSPFSNTSDNSCGFSGAPIRIDPEKGTLFILCNELQQECIFPALLSVCIQSGLPTSLLFSLYADVPEFKTSVEKTLFHFLHNDKIEEAIDLIDGVKYHASSAYEEIVSTMIRLLDENTTEKLYCIIDRNEIEHFTSAESLSKALIKDFSLFDRFLTCAIKEKREDLIFDHISFIKNIKNNNFHCKVLSLLLKKNMLYISGMLLSDTEIKSPETEIPHNLLTDTYEQTNQILQKIKTTKNPAEVLEEVFTGPNTLLIAMVSERLYIEERLNT